jgi:hypothetical protein
MRREYENANAVFVGDFRDVDISNAGSSPFLDGHHLIMNRLTKDTDKKKKKCEKHETKMV